MEGNKTYRHIDHTSADIKQEIQYVKDDFKERVNEIDRYYSETIGEIQNKMEDVSRMARDTVSNKAKDLENKVQEQLKVLQKYIDVEVNDLVIEKKTMIQKNTDEFKNIKVVIAKYFERYDKTMDGVLDQSNAVMKKYENWSKILIEPSAMNDARLFALEERVRQEEDIRVREIDYMRDFLRKLLYSFE